MNKILIFSFGIAAALSALIIQTILTIIFPALENSAVSEKIGYFMLLAIFIEEFIKLGLLWKISKSVKNIFWSSIILGSGFATAEIFLNVLNNNPFNLELFFSYLGLFLIHIFTSSIYGLYLARKENLAIWSTLAIFALGYFLHFLFNFFILISIGYLTLNGGLGILIFLAFFVSKNSKK
ncbi:MAG: hypothetical protein US30_C0003G0050 [Candidatus Moranbacteria bacterium GW2011_GWF2_36_839]|nr:MAG: hypothetical protein US27_C0004G0050 [Candidatus Moranbacteria bacterium GW2011_GWF1_36_78]KKQ17483.1 MAG: hypothetical protein US30_C0003G0050 [Candidatus Moranbacteria bacterium GW2011_GWF2_36_839]HAT73950.1 hypothetical protein [Candidatus Moranbacteria bacterium]HBY10524.1 hypothetical protein [Candidatus Moranbacteria bacterium]